MLRDNYLGVLRNIKENPKDVAHRLILADIIEEGGNPQWAEIVREQTAYMQLPSSSYCHSRFQRKRRRKVLEIIENKLEDLGQSCSAKEGYFFKHLTAKPRTHCFFFQQLTAGPRTYSFSNSYQMKGGLIEQFWGDLIVWHRVSKILIRYHNLQEVFIVLGMFSPSTTSIKMPLVFQEKYESKTWPIPNISDNMNRKIMNRMLLHQAREEEKTDAFEYPFNLNTLLLP